MNKFHRYKIHPTTLVIGRNVRNLRERRELSLLNLEKLSGVDRLTIGKLELGNSNPFFFTVSKLADALDVSVNRLSHDCEREVPHA